ncbi:MAG: DUF4912 domain-containing protein [Pedosphaera sp.]|nr:DUF4912 domain-containing protein [Pedosphaera sp.]
MKPQSKKTKKPSDSKKLSKPIAAKPIAAKLKPARVSKSKTSKTVVKAKSPAKARKPASKTAAKPAKPARGSDVKLKAVSPPPVPGSRPVQRRLAIPKLLLEGDAPSQVLPVPSGPGERYALGPVAPAFSVAGWETPGELPEGYGTKKLFLTARDPHWLFAFWDLTTEQRQEYNRQSAEGHLVVRIYLNSSRREMVSETQVHPESRSWFIFVGQGGARYVAELGYLSKKGSWHSIAMSPATVTPPDRQSDDVSAQFVTLPQAVKFEEVVVAAREALAESLPLVEMIEQLRSEGHAGLPRIPEPQVAGTSEVADTPAPQPDWTPAQTEALAKVIKLDSLRRVWMGSLEITELIRRQLQVDEITGGAGGMAALGAVLSNFELGVSSPTRAVDAKRGKKRCFWFNINAELIIYGSTEKDAEVTIGGRHVKLRPDGSFSFRFALPDGQYELPVTAVASDKEEERRASLTFARSTDCLGDVGAHPQESGLRAPAPENVP